MKYGESYESLANNIAPYLNRNPRYSSMYSPAAYPVWWDKTITVYNAYQDDATKAITWYRNVLDNCFLKNEDAKTMIDNVIVENKSIFIRIPQNMKYKNYSEWLSVPEEQKSEYFTLHQGDIVVLGEVADEIDEGQSGTRSSDLLNKYRKSGICFKIDTFKENVGAGRVLPHYYVSGE